MKNKIIYVLLGVFVFSLIALAGVSYAYKSDPMTKGPNYNEEVHLQLQEAIKNKDYNKWIKIREENNLPTKGKIFKVINEQNFGKYADMHTAMMNGDYETANKIRQELGLNQGMMKKGTGAKGEMSKQSNKQYKQQGYNAQNRQQNNGCTCSCNN